MEIDLSEITESTTIEMDVPKPSDTAKIEPETVEVEINVSEAKEKVFEDVEIEIENAPEDATITFVDREEPVIDITAIGTKEDLDHLKRKDVRASMTFSEYVEGEVFAEIELKGPENTRLRTEEERIRIQIER